MVIVAVPANTALVMGLSVFPLQSPTPADLKYNLKNNRLTVYASTCTCMCKFFFSWRDTFEMYHLDSIHVERYSLERKGHFFILRLLFMLSGGLF